MGYQEAARGLAGRLEIYRSAPSLGPTCHQLHQQEEMQGVFAQAPLQQKLCANQRQPCASCAMLPAVRGAAIGARKVFIEQI